jgi:hypothetical protein
MIVILSAAISMNFNTSGTAHCDTAPQPIISSLPLNFMKALHFEKKVGSPVANNSRNP